MVAVVIAIGSIGCNKQKTEETRGDNPLIGKWIWIKSVGGVAGNVIMPMEGEKRTLEFHGNFTCTITQIGPNPVRYTDQYLLFSINDITTNQEAPAVALYDETKRPLIPQIIEKNNDTLVLKDNCVDCYRHYYKAVVSTTTN